MLNTSVLQMFTLIKEEWVKLTIIHANHLKDKMMQ